MNNLRPKHYRWQGVNRLGARHEGIITALSRTDACAQLRNQSIIVRKIAHIPRGMLRIKTQEITWFTRQLTTLISTGLPLLQALSMIRQGRLHPRMKTLITSLEQAIASGLTVAESLRKHPALFDDLYCNLVMVGELSGTLNTMLNKLCIHRERTARIKRKISKAMAYPLAVMFIGGLITAGLLITVVPQFAVLFANFGAPLPTTTRLVMYLSDFLQHYGSVVCGLIYTIGFAFLYAYKHSVRIARLIDRLWLTLPIVGALIQKNAIARFSSALSISSTAGLVLVDALRAVSKVTGNHGYADGIQKISVALGHGYSLHQAMENTGLFPDMVIQMISLGEESGQLTVMLEKIAAYYEESVDNAVNTFTDILEPIIMAGLGLFVGGLVIALYLPILQLGSII